MVDFALPNDGQRMFICGQTGSGKTRAGVWGLSYRSFNTRPWIIFDYKGDELISAIEYAQEIRIDKKPPNKSGVYVVRPLPNDDEAVQAFLWNVWKQRDIGLYFDEGYMVSGQGKKCPPLDAILTQGRSLSIPCITLTQRPVYLNRFVISEADVFQCFHLNNPNDRERVGEFVPAIMQREVPRYWSHWYNVADRYHAVLKPVPDDAAILERFYTRLKPARRRI